MPLTNFALAERDDYSSQWSPCKDATGATLTNLYTRRGQKYRQMAAGATEKFRWPLGYHRGRYLLSLGCSFGASTAYDQVTVKLYLEDAAGTKISGTDVAPTALDLANPGLTRAYTNDPAAGTGIELAMADTTGFAVDNLVIVSSSAGTEVAKITVVHTNTHLTVDQLALNHTTTNPLVTLIAFKELASQTTRLANVDFPSHFVPPGANPNNIYQCVEVEADASLATTEWLDSATLIPAERYVKLNTWVGNALILDSTSKIALVSSDGSLDTSTAFDPTKVDGAVDFTIDPKGSNYTLLVSKIVEGDEQLIPKVKLDIEYYPVCLLTAEP